MGAMAKTLRLFFGTDKFTFEMTSNNPLAIPPTRTYVRFSDLTDDVVEVRILQGIHFRTADVVGRRQGRHVARFLFKHFLRPVGDHDGDCDDEEDDEEE